MGFLDERSFLLGLLFVHTLSHKLLDLFAIVLVEGHVVVADEVVAFLAAGFGRLAVTPLEPSQHRLANVYAAVVHDVGLYHFVAVRLHDLSQSPSQQVIADVAEVQRFVGIGA